MAEVRGVIAADKADPGSAGQGQAGRDAFSPSYRAYALWLLLFIYTLNFLDRTIINILAEPIKNELGLRDWQIGMMSGLAFALFYTVLGIPIARLAERRNRPLIIAASLAVWSGFSALCGLAQGFGQLVLARIGVGIGEAGCTPAAHSLIAETTPREKRASSLAFYSLGIPLGSLAGMAFGGFVADAFGWRMAFVLAGAPGLLLALVAALSLREPRKYQAALTDAPGQDAISFRAAMAELAGKRSFWWMAMGAALTAFLSYGNGAFLGSFFFRVHGPQLAELAEGLARAAGVSLGPAGVLGPALGLLIGVAGGLGTYMGGASPTGRRGGTLPAT
ncbi:spinster family MFS transporter [Pedomonas mirosovicensis]|uniref:spinster family MFS transporter n=1 Tax=Pedomonas mirosovicensis TaxID=2908641 RepID=UPI00216847D7|nr:MFS transporter [Pedomonas mirosovicensis]MCH8685603.1 MFS transporter [Pedomonas mirosovicensis]